MRIQTLLFAFLIGFFGGIIQAYAQDAPVQTQQKAKQKVQAQEQIYGSQLMTPEERNAFREKMRAAKTQEEREQIRAEHHKEMQERAKVKGVTLPDEPRGPGAGAGKCGGGKCGASKCGKGGSPGGGRGR